MVNRIPDSFLEFVKRINFPKSTLKLNPRCWISTDAGFPSTLIISLFTESRFWIKPDSCTSLPNW